jgi:hypothetical protein
MTRAVKALVLIVLFAGAPACQRTEAPAEVKIAGQLHEFTPAVFHNTFAATTVPVLRVSSGDSIHMTTSTRPVLTKRVYGARKQGIRRPALSTSRVLSLVTPSRYTSLGCG